MKNDRFLSVVIPAYNEEKNIVSTVNEVTGYLSRSSYDYEVLILDDGSADSTFSLANDLASKNSHIRVLKNEKNIGKGYTIKKGMLEASGDHILFMDADNSTSIVEVEKLLPYIKEYDIIIASRRIKGADLDVPPPVLRIVLGNFYVWLSQFFIKSKINDYNCGFKMFSKAAALKIFPKQLMNDWSYDTEDIFLAEKFKLRIKEVPVRWVYKSTSKVKPIRDGIKSFISLVRIKMNDIKGRYGD